MIIGVKWSLCKFRRKALCTTGGRAGGEGLCKSLGSQGTLQVLDARCKAADLVFSLLTFVFWCGHSLLCPQFLHFEMRMFILCHYILEEHNFVVFTAAHSWLWTFNMLELLVIMGTFRVGLNALYSIRQSWTYKYKGWTALVLKECVSNWQGVELWW